MGENRGMNRVPSNITLIQLLSTTARDKYQAKTDQPTKKTKQKASIDISINGEEITFLTC